MSEAESTQAPVILANLGKEALRDLLNNLTQAKAFVLDQAPEFCQQLITRDFGLALFGAIGLGIAFLIFCLIGYLIFKWIQKNDIWDASPVLMAPGFGAVLTLIFSLVNCYDALSIHLAPKVYLVEQLMRMVK